MKSLLIIFFLVNLTNAFSQNGGDPFNLPTYSIEENNIKSISEYNGDDTKIEYAVYDQHGNQIYHEEENRIIEFELDYNEKGYLKKEVAIGFKHEILLKKRPVYNNEGKIDSIIYGLPIAMYYSGFIEKYDYHSDGRIKNIKVYSAPENRLMFQHDYSYASGFKSELLEIRTFLSDDEESMTYFTKKFRYYKNGNVKKSSLLSTKGDTIAINFYGNKGCLLNEIISHFYTTPSSSMYSSTLYSEALEKVKTPLTPFVIRKNLNRKNYQGTQLIYIEHKYENGKLFRSTKSVKHKGEEYILSVENYRYSDQNKLTERVTIDPNNHDTTTVRFTYDQNQRYIHLSENSRSYLVVKKENSSGELIIEEFRNSWECKRMTDFDSITNTVTKKRFCLDDKNQYPSEPEQITVANFDSSGRQINHDTFSGAKKASKNTSYTYSDNGELVRYEYNGRYWKYFYDANDSTLLRQEYFKDSTYEMLKSYYNYEYNDLGNYTVSLVYPNEDYREQYPTVRHFDRDGKLLKKEWIENEWQEKRTISFIYNDLGLCTEFVSSRWGGEDRTRYVYEFY